MTSIECALIHFQSFFDPFPTSIFSFFMHSFIPYLIHLCLLLIEYSDLNLTSIPSFLHFIILEYFIIYFYSCIECFTIFYVRSLCFSDFLHSLKSSSVSLNMFVKFIFNLYKILQDFSLSIFLLILYF